ncbi:MAG: pseudouridine synthase [Candidatus Nomurabacteria bacterium]|nr:pseudouridine synthase [Candidatus Nomurabacteria bacterium]
MKTIQVKIDEVTRLNKFLSEQGVVSRRNADELIKNKLVTINEKVAVLGDKVKTGDVVSFKKIETPLTYALYYKPRGEITGRITSLPGCEPIGRLDKESEGLLLYTNDYMVVDAVLHPIHAREKEYEVQVREKTTPRVVTLLKRGIKTQEATYSPVKSVQIYGEGRSIRITITEGKKHEIRRMLNALNLTVLSLKRVRIMSFVSHGLKAGTPHILSPKQKETLLKDCGIE